MTQEIAYYTTDIERTNLIADAESRRLTMLHDDYNVGPGGSNKLTFHVRAARVQSDADIRKQELLTKLKAEDLTMAEINELARLERKMQPPV